MKSEALNMSELTDLLSVVAETSKSIRTNNDQCISPTAKLLQYEGMLRIVEMLQERPDMVRDNLRWAKESREQQEKIMAVLSR
jgi:predicted DNA-binding protein YlxM (UPF0122 family)